jgi:hypothetical protein
LSARDEPKTISSGGLASRFTSATFTGRSVGISVGKSAVPSRPYGSTAASKRGRRGGARRPRRAPGHEAARVAGRALDRGRPRGGGPSRRPAPPSRSRGQYSGWLPEAAIAAPAKKQSTMKKETAPV